MTVGTSGGYDRLETSPETIEQELRPAVCERRQADRFKENYSMMAWIFLIGRRFAGCPCFFLVFGRDVSIPELISAVVC